MKYLFILFLFILSCSQQPPTKQQSLKEDYTLHIDFCGEYSDSTLNIQVMPELLLDIRNQKYVKIKLESDFGNDSIYHTLFVKKMDSLKKSYPNKFGIVSCYNLNKGSEK